MTAVQLDPHTEKRLENLVAKSGLSKSFYLQKAIQEYLEDLDDYNDAVEASKNVQRTYSSEEMLSEFGS